MKEPQNPRVVKIELSRTKVAVVWRTAMYVLSAALVAKAANEYLAGMLVEAIADVGLAVMFIGLYFRSREAAVMAYVKDPEQRGELLAMLDELEDTCQPWVKLLVRGGWCVMLAGVALQLFG